MAWWVRVPAHMGAQNGQLTEQVPYTLHLVGMLLKVGFVPMFIRYIGEWYHRIYPWVPSKL